MSFCRSCDMWVKVQKHEHFTYQCDLSLLTNKDFFFEKAKVHMDKHKTVLKSHDMDLCLLLTHILTFCFADQVTYIERLRPIL